MKLLPLALLNSRFVLSTSKIIIIIILFKAFIPLTCGRFELMLYVEVTGGS